MTEVGSAAAIGLAACFAWAGASKIAAGASMTAAQFVALGVPAARVAARAVPGVELGVAAGLIMAPRFAALAAVLVLVGFSLVLARAIAHGREVGCNCFGSHRTEPVSMVDLARNGLLASAAALVAATTSTVETPSLAATVASSTATLIALLGLALLRLRRDAGSVWRGPGS